MLSRVIYLISDATLPSKHGDLRSVYGCDNLYGTLIHHVYLADFGFTRPIGNREKSGGTILYMPFEAYYNDRVLNDGRSDIFSLAVTVLNVALGEQNGFMSRMFPNRGRQEAARHIGNAAKLLLIEQDHNALGDYYKFVDILY
jgi:serine/threonine protein kinase